MVDFKDDALVCAQNNTVSIEEFHDQLHKTTNFPLRPFVVPFLKVIVLIWT